jgi:hypothetical protein
MIRGGHSGDGKANWKKKPEADERYVEILLTCGQIAVSDANEMRAEIKLKVRSNGGASGC